MAGTLSKHFNHITLKRVDIHPFKGQRDLDMPRVKAIASDFDWRCVRPITVALFENVYVLVDGQHTLGAMEYIDRHNPSESKRLGIDLDDIPVRVVEVGSWNDLVTLFVKSNTYTKVLSAHELWSNELEVKEPLAVAVNETVTKHGFRVAKNASAVQITSIRGLKDMCRKPNGIDTSDLDRVLETIAKAWPTNAKYTDEFINQRSQLAFIRGMATYYDAREIIDGSAPKVDDVVKALGRAKVKYGPYRAGQDATPKALFSLADDLKADALLASRGRTGNRSSSGTYKWVADAIGIALVGEAKWQTYHDVIF